MELRSRKSKWDEYSVLRSTLRSCGIFEEGMHLKEMRDILTAVQNSSTESNQEGSKMEKENEDGFFGPDQNILNSTMIPCTRHAPQQDITDQVGIIEKKRLYSDSDGSPESPPQFLTVKALVHHPMDWSPPTSERCPRIQSYHGKQSMNSTNDPSSLEPSTSPQSSAADYFPSTSSPQTSDSGFNWSSTNSSSLTESYSYSVRPEEFGNSIRASSSSVALSDTPNTSEDSTNERNIQDDI